VNLRKIEKEKEKVVGVSHVTEYFWGKMFSIPADHSGSAV
jgi:hypothetical protein